MLNKKSVIINGSFICLKFDIMANIAKIKIVGLILSFCFFKVYAQQSNHLVGAQANGSSQVFSSIKLSSGAYTPLSVLACPLNSQNTETTFDDIQSRYFVKKASVIYIINSITGSILDSILNVSSFYNMEYDRFSNTLIGLSPNGASIECKTIDLFTKSLVTKSTLISVDSIIVGESTFDPIKRRYFSMTNLGVTVIDSTGVLRDVLCSSPGLYGMEYNPSSNKIYYLEWNGANYDFVSVEANTCSLGYLTSFNGLTNAVRGESTFDKSNELYYHKTNLGIIEIDAQTGQLQQVLVPLTNFGGMELKGNSSATGIGRVSSENPTTIYPNPSQGYFYFKNLHLAKAIEIFDLNGTVILRTNLSDSSYKLDLQGKIPGIYFYKIYGTFGEIQSGKLILRN